MIWTEQQARTLRAVFSALNKSGIEWMVLRNYEGLPDENRSKDIDLVIRKHDFSLVYGIVADALTADQFSIVSHSRFQYAWCFSFFNVTGEYPCSIKIDLLDGFVWRGAKVVDFVDLYARKIQYADFFVPDPVYDGFMLWVKPLMTGGFVKGKYRPDILRTLIAYPHEFRSLLTSTFGKGLSQELWPLLERKDLEGTIKYQKRMCHAAWRIAFAKHPIDTIASTIDHFYKEIRRRSRRAPGSMIAIIGPDGSGKSTVIDLLQKELSRVLVKDTDDVCILHFRPNIFPNLKKLLGGKGYEEKNERFTSPHRARPAGRASSFLRLAYYWLDYLLGYWLRIRRRCIAGKVYIFDRYFYDFIVDPYRSRIKLPYWLRLLFLKMTPEPEEVFFLDCDTATIYNRKQELTRTEIERQLEGYRTLARKFPRFHIVDSRKPVEKIVHEISGEYVRRIGKPVDAVIKCH